MGQEPHREVYFHFIRVQEEKHALGHTSHMAVNWTGRAPGFQVCRGSVGGVHYHPQENIVEERGKNSDTITITHPITHNYSCHNSGVNGPD